MPASTPTGKSPTDESGERTIKPVTKIRGGDAKKYAAKVKAPMAHRKCAGGLRKPFDPRKPETFPRIVAPYQNTSRRNALASRHRWTGRVLGPDPASRAREHARSTCTASATSEK